MSGGARGSGRLGIGIVLLLLALGYSGALVSRLKSSEPFRAAEAFLRQGDAMDSIVGAGFTLGRFPTGSFDAVAGEGTFSLSVHGSRGEARVRLTLERLGEERWEVVEARYRTVHGREGVLLEKNMGPRRRAHGHLVRGHDLYTRTEYAEALREYEEALRWAPDDPDIYYWRARLFLEQNRIGEATADFERAVDLDPTHHHAHDSLGYIYGRAGDYPRSIAHFTRAIAGKPTDGMRYYSRGISYVRSGDLERARDDMRQACRHGYQDGCRAEQQLRSNP